LRINIYSNNKYLSDKVSGFRMIGGFFDYSYKTVVNDMSEIFFYSQFLCNLFFFPNSCHFLILKFYYLSIYLLFEYIFIIWIYIYSQFLSYLFILLMILRTVSSGLLCFMASDYLFGIFLFHWPLYHLVFFVLWLLIIPLVFSSFIDHCIIW
jgi:hypothetical protein